MEVGDATVDGRPTDPESATSVAKSKRTRTGCLTCRGRHLKCDESFPNCRNCVKSKKSCKRGIRLNFIDTHAPTDLPILPPSRDWHVSFQDESRDIAAEYEGGKDRYQALPTPVNPSPSTAVQVNNMPPPMNQYTLQQPQPEYHQRHVQAQQYTSPRHQQTLQYDFTQQIPPAPALSYQELPSAHNAPRVQTYTQDPLSMAPQTHSTDMTNSQDNNTSPFTNYNPNMIKSPITYTDSVNPQTSLDAKREQLSDPKECLYMQVFCEEVGIWMDSMDPLKHFSRLLPFHSLAEPMLRNAFLACGARHLTLINPIYTEDRALLYYDTATRHLLENLQDPNRDTVVCATTAVILNVYEIMCERALPRMNHIAGARALIKECGWNARAIGVGAACFWLNVGLEVLSCLHFNWQVAWDPDDWGLDMDFSREIHNGREEIWTHRMLYIVAKVANYRATAPHRELPDAQEEKLRKQARYTDWCRLRDLANTWNNSIPRTMHPMAYIHPQQTASKSCFPEVWLIKRTTIVARLFYHTVMVLLAQCNPLQPRTTAEMWEMERTHSQTICGISAHVKDRGVASVALRSLAHAAESLTDRREQQEVLQIFEKINRETGWRIAFIFKELKSLWAWQDDPSMPTPHITSNADPTPRPIHTHTGREGSISYSAANTVGGYSPVEPTSAHSRQGSTIGHHGAAMMGAGGNVSGLDGMPGPSFRASPSSSTTSSNQGGSNNAGGGRGKPPPGIKNPLFANADFSMPQHPYQNVYVAPNLERINMQANGLYY